MMRLKTTGEEGRGAGAAGGGGADHPMQPVRLSPEGLSSCRKAATGRKGLSGFFFSTE